MAHRFNITAANDQFKFDFSYNSEKIFWSEYYKQKSSAKSAIESLQKNAPGAITVDLSKDETGTGYRFEIVESKVGQHFVRFVASNGETMVRTETYASKASAKNAIESLKSNGPAAAVADEADFLPLPSETLPPQDMGTHFEIHEGLILPAFSSTIDEIGDMRRLEVLQPLVRDALEDLLDALTSGTSGDNDPHFRLRRQTRRYLDAIDKDVRNIDYGYIFGLGSMLQNRLDADLSRSGDSDLAPLTDRQRVALKDFQDQHGPFLTSSQEGLRSLAAAERVERNPEQERALATDISALAHMLESGPQIASPEVPEILKEAAAEMGKGRQADRLAVYGVGTARNLAIVAVAGAIVAAGTTVGGALLGPPGAAGGAMLTLPVFEALKRSGAFKELSDPIARILDQAKAAQFSDFAKSATPLLLRIAGDRPEMKWLRDYASWLARRK